MFQLYVDGRMYEYVKKKERRRRIKAKGAQEERSRAVGGLKIRGEGAFSNVVGMI